MTIETPTDVVHIQVCNDSTLHITSTPNNSKAYIVASPWVLGGCNSSAFSISITDHQGGISTSRISVVISATDGLLSFHDFSGAPLLSEMAGRSYDPTIFSGLGIYRVTDRFFPKEDEGIYGLGQHQTSMFNYRGSVVLLSQMNTDVAVPFFLSTKGYGILWNTASTSIFDNRYPNQLNLVASAAAGLDYYFFYGPEADQIIHQYRQLTGHAPLFAKWAYGLFQSKDHYQSQDELLGVIDNYRSHDIPADTIVQDWLWWTKQGSSSFNPRYSDMRKTIGTLHEQYHAHIMISIWPTFDPDAEIAQEMAKNHFLIPGTYTYDATNPSARNLYWKLLAGPLFSQGMDAFWLDDTEPEQPGANQSIQPGSNLFQGQSALYSNVYPFMHTLGIYENWRKTTEKKRVFLLSRSAFAGSQHNAAATWSGDVYSTFWALSRQIPAGLNFALSGLPYWTTDIGGYGHPSYKSTEDPLFQELYTRWFEYGTFCPIFRTHGHRANNRNELTAFGKATPTLVLYDRLRYRMLPYIYSLAWRVTNDDYTIMRPLVMDWRQDDQVRDIGDEFMFGPALLVAPVTKAGATSRPVYLPHAGQWYDFWTGEAVSEGSRISSAPIERIPLYVRAGAILPLGPDVEYAAQVPDDPIEVRIYPGANGNFNYYEDEGDTYQYEKGAHSIIPFYWDDKTQRLTIGAREGVYSGMSAKRHFMIVKVRRNHGVGTRVTESSDRQVEYSGRPVEVQMNGKGSDISGMPKRPIMTSRPGAFSH